MTRIGRRHWSIALTLAVLLHGGVAAAVLWQAPVVGASSAGFGGVEVSLGPAGGAPGSAAAPVEELSEAEVVEPSEAETAPPPEEQTAREELAEPPEVEAEQAEAAEPQAVTAERVPVETAEVTEVQEAQTAVVEAVEAEPQQSEEVQAGPPPETVQADRQPQPPLPQSRPKDLSQPASVAETKPEQPAQPLAEPQQTQTAKLPPSTAGAGGKAGTEDSPEAGSANDSSGGGNPGQVADYMARLQAWLERHKEYPRHARQRRQEGTVLLYFVMDRDGRVLDYRLKQSSGYDLLDHAVEEMIQRAQPLPKMPQEMRQARLELIVPVQFFLR